MRRIPAVSMNFQVMPPRLISSSTGSRVVPASSLTTTRSSPATLFSREDLPTFGRPMSAMRRGPPSAVPKLCAGASGRASRTASSMSPVPRPCREETGCGSPRPSDQSAVASASPLCPSTLFAHRTTGFLALRSSLTTASSVSVAPTVASTTKTTASAVEIAYSAWAATEASRPSTSCSQPPVSTTLKRRPAHSAS